MMIVWLASYPRSGNTLLRTIFRQTMGRCSASDEPELADEDWIVRAEDGQSIVGAQRIEGDWDDFYRRASDSDEVFLVKTHRPPRDDQPAIYVVRDGRSACASYARFHEKFTRAARPSLMEIVLGLDYYGGWSDHYRQWACRPRTHLVRYESLVECTRELAGTLAAIIGFDDEIREWQNPFDELHAKRPDFFRSGKVRWQGDEGWTPLIDQIFFELHGESMHELGYADERTATAAVKVRPAEISALASTVRRLHQAKTGLQTVCDERLAVINELKAACDARLALINEMEAKETVIQEQAGALAASSALLARSEAALEKSQQALSLKEETISHLAKALKAYRLAHPILSPVSALREFLRSPEGVFAPRLGKLSHHPPRPLRLSRSPAAGPTHDLPSISVVTPSFRQGDFIERTMLSVLDQAYPRLEYRIQDGGSDDGTLDLLEKLQDRLSAWTSEPDDGQAQAINRGFSQTSGEIMAWLNSDDLFMPGTLARVGAYFARHPEVDVVYGHRILIDEQDREIGRWVLPRHDDAVLSWVDFVPQETLFWRRRIWEKVGSKVDESFQFALDWDLLVRFREAGAHMVRIPYFLGGFRIHDAQKTSASIHAIGLAEMDRIRQRIHGHIPTHQQIRRAIAPYMLRHLLDDFSFRLRERWADRSLIVPDLPGTR